MATLVKLSWQAESHAALGVDPPRVANLKKDKHETIINSVTYRQRINGATSTHLD